MIILLAGSATALGQEIELRGNPPAFDLSIATGDTTPRTEDGTDFGVLEAGEESVDRTFRILNLSPGTALSVFSITVNSPDFAILSGAAAPGIPPQGSHDFTIRFEPATTGSKNAIVTINNNDPDGGESPFTFQVRGFGEAPAGTAFFWQGNAPVTDWNEPLNWNPLGIPDVTGDTATINFNTAPNHPQLTSLTNIGDLSISNGGGLQLGSSILLIRDTVVVNGNAGVFESFLDVQEGRLDTDFLFIQDGGRVSLGGGIIEVDFNPIIGDESELRGYGTFQTDTATSTNLVNDGSIVALGVLGGLPGRLTITREASSTAEFDWDGTDNKQAELFVSNNATLDIDMPLADTTYNGNIKLSGNSVLDAAGLSFSLGGTALGSDPGVLTKQAFGPVPGLGTIIASLVVLDAGSSADVVVGTLAFDTNVMGRGGNIGISPTGTMVFEGPMDADSGTIVNQGSIEFCQDATIGSAVDFQMAGPNASLVVGPGATVTVNDSNFDLDAVNAATNLTTIKEGGLLDINLNNAGADDSYGHVLNLEGAELDVTNAADAQPWSLNSNCTVNAISGNSTIDGDELLLFSGDINVAAGATLRVVTDLGPVTSSTTHIDVAAGARITLGRGVDFNGGTFTGAGTLRCGASTVASDTTIGTGVFDWDGTSNGQLHIIKEQATFTINSPNLEATGADNMNDPIELAGDGSTLVVNGPPEWIKGSNAINANTTQVGTAAINGTSRLVLRSTLNIVGDTEIGASFTLDGGAISIDAGSTLNFTTFPGSTIFENGSTTNMAGDLRLSGSLAIVEAGAIFTGSGELSNWLGTLTLLDGADVNVGLSNWATVEVGSSPGRVTGLDFEQGSTGVLEIEIQGPGSNEYDRMDLTGTALCGGTLKVTLLDGFRPSPGQTFTIISADGGILTSFPTEDFSSAPLDPGLTWQVKYFADKIELEVVGTGSPFEQWINSFPSLVNPAEKTKAANPDGDPLNNLGEFALDGNPSRAVADGKINHRIATVGGEEFLTLTFPVRTGALPSAGDPPGGPLVLVQAADGVLYSVEAGEDLRSFLVTVNEVTGADADAIQGGLPAVHAGWEYRTFRSAGPVAGNPLKFMRVSISEP